MLAQISGIEVVFVAFGGAFFGASSMLLVMTYAWGARSTAREIRMLRYRERIRGRFHRMHGHTPHVHN